MHNLLPRARCTYDDAVGVRKLGSNPSINAGRSTQGLLLQDAVQTVAGDVAALQALGH